MDICHVKWYCSCHKTKVIYTDNLGFIMLGFFCISFIWLNVLFWQVGFLECLAYEGASCCHSVRAPLVSNHCKMKIDIEHMGVP